MSGFGGLLREAKRLRAELEAASNPWTSPTCRRVEFARKFYDPDEPALLDVFADPDSPRTIFEFRLDQFLAGPAGPSSPSLRS
jgi:hypothetical protein